MTKKKYKKAPSGAPRGKNRNKYHEVDDAEMEIETLPSILSVKQSNFSRKRRKKYAKFCRENILQLYKSSLQAEKPPTLPLPLPVSPVDSQVLSYLQKFINRYLDLYEDLKTRVNLASCYSDNSTLTLQSSSLISKSLIKQLGKTDPICPVWRIYEPFSFNLLPGQVPLPSWACFMMVKDQIEPKIIGQKDMKKLDLSKSMRMDLKLYKSIQKKREKYYSSADRSYESSDDWRRSDIPKPASPRSGAVGRNEILGVIMRMPPCKHIRIDTCCALDVPIAAACGIVMRFSCLMVEALPSKIIYDMHPSSNYHVIPFGDIGAAVVRLVQRTMIIAPDPVNEILQEDISILPAPFNLVKENSDAIRKALFGEEAAENQQIIEHINTHVATQHSAK